MARRQKECGLTRRERVIQAIEHHQTDIVPYTVDLTRQAQDRLIEFVRDPGYIDRIGNHVSGVGYGSYEEVEPGSGFWRDHFGVVWNRNGADKDIGVVDVYHLPEPTLQGYKFPTIDKKGLRAKCESALARAEDTCCLFCLGFSVFERAWILRGMENLLMDMVAESDFVHELFNVICEYNFKVLDIVLEYPFDGVFFGDDWGQQNGTIMGPAHWRTYIKPVVEKMYAKVRNKGKIVAQHSCGDIRELFPELIDIGLNLYQTFQPEIYDVEAVKQEFGNHLAFWGGISTQRVLPYVTPDEVKHVARKMMSMLSVSGGYIAGPTHGIPGDVPPENIVALVEAFQQQ